MNLIRPGHQNNNSGIFQEACSILLNIHSNGLCELRQPVQVKAIESTDPAAFTADQGDLV